MAELHSEAESYRRVLTDDDSGRLIDAVTEARSDPNGATPGQ